MEAEGVSTPGLPQVLGVWAAVAHDGYAKFARRHLQLATAGCGSMGTKGDPTRFGGDTGLSAPPGGMEYSSEIEARVVA